MDSRPPKDSKDAQDSQAKATSSRPQSPERPTSPDPERGSRYKMTISSIPLFATPKPKSGGMHHSQSMPEFGTEDSTSPKSPTSPLSPSRLRGSTRSTSPISPSSPSGRKFLKDNHADEIYKIYRLAALEDAIQSTLPDGFSLAEFTSCLTDDKVAPGLFYCSIANAKGDVVFRENFPEYKLNQLEDFVEAFNKQCPYVVLSAESITRRMDPNNFILSTIKLEFGNAVFVTGESNALGNWTTCLRLNFNKTQQAWRLTLPEGIDDPRYKFKTGLFAEGKTADSNKLVWEDLCGNRQLLPSQLQASRKSGLKL